jgi:hypothetical protein
MGRVRRGAQRLALPAHLSGVKMEECCFVGLKPSEGQHSSKEPSITFLTTKHRHGKFKG